MKEIEIHTDGACLGNPGPGGWAALLRYKGHERELAGGEGHTTNNRMELRAVIEGLQAIKRPCRITLYLDSQYVRQGITSWIHNWKRKGWKTADNKPVKNADLWQQLDALVHNSPHQLHWEWVKGHAGNPGNEKADELANRGVEQVQTQP